VPGSQHQPLQIFNNFSSNDRPHQSQQYETPPSAISTIANIMEREYSTYSKREMGGVCYSWGQNTDGQLGSALVEGLMPQIQTLSTNTN
jgi:hypothetical protein